MGLHYKNTIGFLILKKEKLFLITNFLRLLQDECRVVFFTTEEIKNEIENSKIENKEVNFEIVSSKTIINLKKPKKKIIHKNNFWVHFMILPFKILKFKKKLNNLRIRFIKYRFFHFFIDSDRSGPSIESCMLILCKEKSVKTSNLFTSQINSGKKMKVLNQNKVKGILEKLFYLIHKKYVFYHEGQSYYFYNISDLLCLKFFGVLTKNPFYLGNNNLLSYLILDNKSTYESNKKEILFPNKIKFLGDINYLTIQKHRKKVDRALFILPQFYEHKILDSKNSKIEINYLIKTINKQLNKEIDISLHPKCKLSDYEYLNKFKYVKIINQPLAEIIDKYKISFSVNSSTVFWGFFLGLKIVIFDFYDLQMSFFHDMKSLIIFKKKIDFEKNLSKKINSKTVYSDNEKVLLKNYLSKEIIIKRHQEFIFKK